MTLPRNEYCAHITGLFMGLVCEAATEPLAIQEARQRFCYDEQQAIREKALTHFKAVLKIMGVYRQTTSLVETLASPALDPYFLAEDIYDHNNDLYEKVMFRKETFSDDLAAEEGADDVALVSPESPEPRALRMTVADVNALIKFYFRSLDDLDHQDDMIRDSLFIAADSTEDWLYLMTEYVEAKSHVPFCPLSAGEVPKIPAQYPKRRGRSPAP